MSNKRCPRCGKSYPSSYQSCPYCSGGSRRRRQPEGPLEQIVEILRQHGERIFLMTTAVFLVIAVFGMVLTRCSSEKPAPAPNKPEQQQPEQQDPPPQTDPLIISNETLSLTVGETALLTVAGGTGTPVWTTSDETVADVSGGTVTAKAAGTATIAAACETERVICVVTVKDKDPDVELYLNRTDFTLSAQHPDFQMQLKVKETKKNYEGSVVWSIEDTSVATVDETGFVKRVGRGNTKLTATVGSKTYECIVRVRAS